MNHFKSRIISSWIHADFLNTKSHKSTTENRARKNKNTREKMIKCKCKIGNGMI